MFRQPPAKWWMAFGAAAFVAGGLFCIRNIETRELSPASALQNPAVDLGNSDFGTSRLSAQLEKPAAEISHALERGVATLAAAARASELNEALASNDAARLAFALTKLLPEWVAENAEEAAKWAIQVTDPDLREEVQRVVAQVWAAINPNEALAWAEKLPIDEEREAALTDVSVQVSLTDPGAAVKMRARSVPEGSYSSALENLTQRWAEQDFSAALAWTLARPEVGARDALVERLVFVQAQTAPAMAITLGQERITNPDTRVEALLSVVHQWARRDWSAACSWVAEMAPGAMRDRAVAELSATRAAAGSP